MVEQNQMKVVLKWINSAISSSEKKKKKKRFTIVSKDSEVAYIDTVPLF